MRHMLLAVASTAVLAAGCGIEMPAYRLSEYTRGELLGTAASEPDQVVSLHPEIETALDEILWDKFSSPWYWAEEEVTQAAQVRLQHGAELYRKHCIHCHGLEGAGDGPTAKFLYPRPRDYRRGVFKWKSTERNAKPTREDLLHLIQNGAMGTSMPPFVLMPEEDLEAIVDYVVYLSKRGDLERRLLIYLDTQAPSAEELASDESVREATIAEMKAEAEEMYLPMIEQQWAAAGTQVLSPEQRRPDIDYNSRAFRESLARGKELYLSEKASCYKCHSADGKAKDIAPSERDKMVDDWGNPNYPRNLTLGLYRGGRRPVDVYRRIHQGIAGAAMPEGGRNLTPNEIWDLVNFTRALPYEGDVLLPGTSVSAAHANGDSH